MSKTKDQIQAEAIAALGNKSRAGVEISMGVGKTRIGLTHMASNYTDYSKFLVVAPRKSIIESWTDELSKANMSYLNDHITYSTYRSLTKQELDYDVIYLDECHSLKASHNKWLIQYVKQGGRIIGLTGTYPTRTTSEKGKMCNYYCPKVYEYLTEDAVSDNILNDYEIYIHELNLSNKKNIGKEGKHGNFYTSETNDYYYWCNRVEIAETTKSKQIASIQRMKCLQKFDTKEKYARLIFNEQADKTIIFANTQAQADSLCTHSVHSKNKDSKNNLELFKNGQLTKLSAVEQLSEGVTIPELKTGIIMHAYGNNRKAAQKIGRLLRLNPDDKATIHILCYSDTIDKEWVTSALDTFNENKIHWIKPKYYAGVHY